MEEKKYDSLGSFFKAIANSIRNKMGKSETEKIKAEDFPDLIDGISTGTDTSDATLNNSNQMLKGYSAYSKGTKYTGNIPTITPPYPTYIQITPLDYDDESGDKAWIYSYYSCPPGYVQQKANKVAWSYLKEINLDTYSFNPSQNTLTITFSDEPGIPLYGHIVGYEEWSGISSFINLDCWKNTAWGYSMDSAAQLQSDGQQSMTYDKTNKKIILNFNNNYGMNYLRYMSEDYFENVTLVFLRSYKQEDF